MFLKETLFLKTLERTRAGALEVVLPDGKRHHFEGTLPGPQAELIVRDGAMYGAMLSGGINGFAESYMRGEWETGDLCALLRFGAVNTEKLRDITVAGKAMGLLHRGLHMLKPNTKSGSRKNIHAHYDLGNDFYSLWLDETMSYSSALYREDNMSLKDAQVAKYGRILERLGEARNESVLEIGCGWGGFMEEAAKVGKKVTGLTISNAQGEYARQRLKEAGEVVLRDYRDEQGVFDHIVSIEMFEAVGEKYWPDYFRTLKQRLKEGGRAVIQTIVIEDKVFPEYRKRADFIQRHIFPGGMLPSGHVFEEHAKKAGLKVTDAFAFGKDYARTLSEWLDRFDAVAGDVKKMGFADAFMRKWRFYLAYCHGGFASGRTDVIQYEMMHA